jgi:hypothetical protein
LGPLEIYKELASYSLKRKGDHFKGANVAEEAVQTLDSKFSEKTTLWTTNFEARKKNYSQLFTAKHTWALMSTL